MTLHENLKKIRESKNLSQADLALKTGLKVSAISHFETGRRVPTWKNLLKLKEALNVSMDDFCKDCGCKVGHSSNCRTKIQKYLPVVEAIFVTPNNKHEVIDFIGHADLHSIPMNVYLVKMHDKIEVVSEDRFKKHYRTE